MANFSPLERYIAKILTRFPMFKSWTKHIYSRLSYLIAKKKYKYQSLTELQSYVHSRYNSFFGYYDKSPMNIQGLVLACLTEQSSKQRPSAAKAIELGIFTGTKLLFKTQVKSYNWQQGCRAHWLSDDEFIFNDFEPEAQSYVARVFSVSKTAEINRYAFAVQDSFQDEYFISLNYRRLMALRPDYGYRNLPVSDAEQLAHLKNDGLWYVNIQTGESRLLVSIQQACQLKVLSDFDGAQHKFNHVLISPNGQQLIFMHRFLSGKRRTDRLLLYDMPTKKLNLLADFGMVSHCFWADDFTILGYMRGPENVDAYWLINTKSGEFSRLPNNALQGYGDGHPHVYGDWFVTDTYPDKARMQHLLLCNWKTGAVKELGQFIHGFDFDGESRCDLHPRFSMDGKKVFFDSVYTGQRQLYSIVVGG